MVNECSLYIATRTQCIEQGLNGKLGGNNVVHEMDPYESVQLKARNINCFVKYTPRDAGDKPSGRGGALKTIPPGNSIFFFFC